MKLAIMIHSHQNWKGAVESARELASAIQSSDHSLEAVFFYGSAVAIHSHPALQQSWLEAGIDCPKWICQTVVEQQQPVLDPNLLQPEFQVLGMAQWMQTVEQVDRVVNIG